MSNDEFAAYLEYLIGKKGDLTHFEKNVMALSTYLSKLAKMLAEWQLEGGESKFKAFRGKDPLAINITENSTSLSLYDDPLADVTKQLDEFEKKYSRYGALFIYGIGNGVLIKALLENSSHKHIVVFEPEIEILAFALQAFDFSKDILKQRLIIARSDVFIFPHYHALVKIDAIYFCSRIYNLYINKPFYERYIDDIAHVNHMYSEAIKQRLREIGNDGIDALTGMRHTTQHIPDMINGIALSSIIKQRKNKVKTAIIVSTGPSLTKQLELLKKLKDHATIISADASYPILKKHGIKPDFVTTIEREEKTGTLFDDKASKFDENIIFAASSLTHDRTMKNMKNRTYTLIMRPLSYENGFMDKDFGYLGCGQSCAHLAYELAVHLEHKRIIFIGQDLAFGENDSHHADDYKYNSEVQPTEDPNSVYVESAPAYGGKGEVKTTTIWNLFRQTFESMFALKDKNLEIYNCTEGGARIAGSVEKPFKEMAEIVINEAKPEFLPPQPLSQKIKEAKLKKYSKHLLSVIKYGEKTQKKFEKAFLNLAKQVKKAKALKAKGQNEKIDYEKLQKLSFEIDEIKNLINDKRFRASYFTVCCMHIYNEELEFTKILARPSDTLEEKQDKLLEWLGVQGHWLFSMAGYISVVNENLKECSKDWLIENKA